LLGVSETFPMGLCCLSQDLQVTVYGPTVLGVADRGQRQ
jgi:hypothetical protein